MKTLYTGHLNINSHYIYSFIYAATLLEAEEYLRDLLNRYIHDHYTALSPILPDIKIVSRPNGWNPPDGYYLPGTSKQYALKYPVSKPTGIPQQASVLSGTTSPLAHEIEFQVARRPLSGS